MLSDQNLIKVEISNRKIAREFPNIWKLNSLSLTALIFSLVFHHYIYLLQLLLTFK